jgi:hydrogenase expression/formation protein HypD
MKYLSEYRDADAAQKLGQAINDCVTRPWKIMEICGGQTHSIVRFGIDQLLPSQLTLIHGPGCPVCVTPIELIDKSIAIASLPNVIFCSFGDMLRVPGSSMNLLKVKAAGGDIRIVYSPLDAVSIAQENPAKEVVFFAIGFETTAPANAMAVYQARKLGLKNFSLLVSHVLVPPAIEAILKSPQLQVQGFLAAGHVCTVMGFKEYEPLAAKYRIPIVVTGFEPLDILHGILLCARQLEDGRHTVENQYKRSVTRPGNIAAQRLIKEVFEVSSRAWRGIGVIPDSGLSLRQAFHEFDAERRFDIPAQAAQAETVCISGQILQGLKSPLECPAFDSACSPEQPLGATMVSSEGACAAYYRYRRQTSK